MLGCMGVNFLALGQVICMNIEARIFAKDGDKLFH